MGRGNTSENTFVPSCLSKSQTRYRYRRGSGRHDPGRKRFPEESGVDGWWDDVTQEPRTLMILSNLDSFPRKEFPFGLIGVDTSVEHNYLGPR